MNLFAEMEKKSQLEVQGVEEVPFGMYSKIKGFGRGGIEKFEVSGFKLVYGRGHREFAQKSAEFLG